MGKRVRRFEDDAVLERIVERAMALVKELMVIAERVQTAAELEAEVVVLWREAGAAALEELLSLRFGRQEGRWRPCACGGRMRFERYRARKALTVLGPAEVKRAYYRCGACKATSRLGGMEGGGVGGCARRQDARGAGSAEFAGGTHAL